MTQYGVRLSQEPDMPWTEFCSLLAGLMHDTPLGRIVAIRAEEDREILSHFTPEQRRVRAEWRRRTVRMDDSAYAAAMQDFEAMFRGMAGKGDEGK